MAINYTKVNGGNGWDTTCSLGPTNLNKMENGIKAACDGVDGLSSQNYKSRFNFESNDYFTVDMEKSTIMRYGNMMFYNLYVTTLQPMNANCLYFFSATTYATGTQAEGCAFINASNTTQGSNAYTCMAHYQNGTVYIIPDARGMARNYTFRISLVGAI